MATTVYIDGVKVRDEDLKNITIESKDLSKILLEKLSSVNSKDTEKEEPYKIRFKRITQKFF
ncbi:hypothetical protein D5278_20970 [bacterium 1XD21-13]|nr:hypothetical protein [bacterium 1XD21-13]